MCTGLGGERLWRVACGRTLPCRLIPSPVRHAATTPIVKLGPEFASLSDFLLRMPHIPDISDLEHLTVSGDVYFGRNIVVKVRQLRRMALHSCQSNNGTLGE